MKKKQINFKYATNRKQQNWVFLLVQLSDNDMTKCIE